MEEKERKQGFRIIMRLSTISITLLILGLGFLIGSLLISNSVKNKYIVVSVSIMVAFSLMAIALIILATVYKEYRYLKCDIKKSEIKELPLYELDNFKLDLAKENIRASLDYNEPFYILNKFNPVARKVSYYFYFVHAMDYKSEIKLQEFKDLELKNKAVLLVILDGFNLKPNDLANLNSYDKTTYMDEYLNNTSKGIILIAFDRAKDKLLFFNPGFKHEHSCYKMALDNLLKFNKEIKK